MTGSRVPSSSSAYEVKHLGHTVRVNLPPESYSPPDSPVPLVRTEEPEEDADLNVESTDTEGGNDETVEKRPQKSPTSERVPRRKAFPWPPAKVRTTPEEIALPQSPTPSDLSSVESVLSPGAQSEVSLPSDNEEPPVWQGKKLRITVPDQVS